jgi:hypothetical protein
MKRLLSMALALTIAGTSAASAHGPGRGPYGPPGPGFGGYGKPYRNNNGDVAMALGFGMLALGVIGIIASQDRAYSRPYYGPAVPPPPPPAPYGSYGYGYGATPPPPAPYGGYGYNGGYGPPSGGGYGNYGSNPYPYGR